MIVMQRSCSVKLLTPQEVVVRVLPVSTVEYVLALRFKTGACMHMSVYMSFLFEVKTLLFLITIVYVYLYVITLCYRVPIYYHLWS